MVMFLTKGDVKRLPAKHSTLPLFSDSEELICAVEDSVEPELLMKMVNGLQLGGGDPS